MLYHDACKQFDKAVRSLTGSGTQQERLVDALTHIIELPSERLPEELRNHFEGLTADAVKVASFNNREIGQIRTTVDGLDHDALRQMIDRIVRLYKELVIASTAESG